MNWLQKRLIKKTIKKAKKKIKDLANKIEEQADYRHKVEEAVLELTQILEIQPFTDRKKEDLPKEIKQNTILNQYNIKYLTNQELETLWNESLKTIEKEL